MSKWIFVLCGASASGKTALANLLCKKDYGKLITCTTREPRNGEKDCRDYYFYNNTQFDDAMAKGMFLETETYCGHRYGVLTDELEDKLSKYDVLIAVLGESGCTAIRQQYINVRAVYISAPVSDITDRLQHRYENNQYELSIRLQDVKKPKNISYDFCLGNYDLDKATHCLGNYITAVVGNIKSDVL